MLQLKRAPRLRLWLGETADPGGVLDDGMNLGEYYDLHGGEGFLHTLLEIK